MKLTPRQRTLIAAVRAHATENYNSGGWDVVVECYDDEAIAKVIGRARTVKGALAKFVPIIDVLADRQAAADYEIRAAVGEPEAVEHYRTGSEYGYYEGPGCNCGARFATDKAADLHVVKAMQAAGTYDPRAQGYHPDGSFVSWKHDGESGESWAVRSWQGKAGRASIVYHETEDGYELVETYIPGWNGTTLYSDDYCNHRGAAPGSFWECEGDHCNPVAHPNCEVPF